MKIRPILLLAAVAALAFCADAPAADFAFEIRCEQQYTDAELADLIWSQGTTPLIAARTYERGKAVPPREDVTVQMMIAPSATSRYWAAVTNQATNATSYLLQWPTIGTNTTADAPWYYVLYFLRDGRRYWTGSGNLWIEETSATGDGLVWQEITSIDLATLTNDIQRISDFALDMDNLRGELQGPAWLTPARFEWQADILTTVTTNTGEEVDGGWAVLTRERTVVTEKDYILDPAIERNQWNETLETSVDGPATLDPIGNGTYLLSWIDGTLTGTTAKVSGQLGEWRDAVTVELKESGNVMTQQWFSSFAPGGVLEAINGVYTAWTNRGGTTHRLIHHGSASLTNWSMRTDTNNIYPNPTFWGRDLDWSGVSFVNDSSRPWNWCIALVASNLAYGASHWGPPVGTTVAWYGKDGAIHTSKVVDARWMNYDLRLSKLYPPLDTNAVTAYPILDTSAARNHVQECDIGRGVYGMPPLAIAAMHQNQRAYIQETGSFLNGFVSGIWDSDHNLIPNSYNGAIGGDSGHPVFFTTDGSNMVLYGAWRTVSALSVPGADEAKPLIRASAESMGADPDSIRWETWADWPTYLGPLSNP